MRRRKQKVSRQVLVLRNVAAKQGLDFRLRCRKDHIHEEVGYRSRLEKEKALVPHAKSITAFRHVEANTRSFTIRAMYPSSNLVTISSVND